MEKAEKLGDIASVIETNDLKQKISEKIEEVKKGCKKYWNVQKKRKKIPKGKFLTILEKKCKFLFIKVVEP